MKLLIKLLNYFKKAEVTPWKASGSELTTAGRPDGSTRVGSFAEQHPDGEEYKGIKVTLPLPGEKL